ncbi:unnamed protein product [Miscanthus lutarioriparius]|uniref:BRCT domain-containing protein n=1 Tax=Miscanthus lutarioriparius TaxID=422564 RepID=A0A811NQ04_9POAL|nr:unnamed protein product [Miscanthus lutarioriparius]
MSLVAYDASSDEEDAGEPPAAEAPQPAPIVPQPRPPSPLTAVGAAHRSTPPPPAASQSVAPINSSNVSLPTPSLDLPDVADLFAPPADNASRKRESNGSALHDSRSKIPRMQSQPRGIRNAAGNTLIPPQLRGRFCLPTSASNHSLGTMSTARVQGRLDYLNSQEPGDESQATAIDIVERLLVEDDIGTSQKMSAEPMSGTKSASILGTKVAQCLAKRGDCRSPLQKTDIFDWADASSNDECAAIMISRKKQRIHANTQAKNLTSQRYGGSGPTTIIGSILECNGGDSGLSSFKKPEPLGSTDDLYDAYDIGPCTQMAAEAMEALSNASTVNHVVRENAHPESSVLRTNLGKESKANKICSEPPIQKRIGGSSRSVKKNPSKSKDKKGPKQMAGKAKGSMGSITIEGDTNREVSEGIKGSGPSDSNIVGSDAVIHPKRKRTYTFISRSSKVQFNKAGSSTTLSSKSTGVADSSTTNQVSLSGPDLNQLARLLEKQSTSAQEDHNPSLINRVPLRELNSKRSQFRTQISKNPLKRGLVKSSGSRELASLLRNEASPVLQTIRQRRNMSKVHVLLSQSMDKETIKMQTKILIYFGLPVATTISEATHFVAEKFARTRNMLEAIAMGIPVVTPSWLECCSEARCFIDEKKYIMRDMKKEKELGFSMHVSLSRACKKPLLQGRRVLITPNAKPSKELLKSLVVAAHGQPLGRITASSMKNKNFEGAFVISCEQDHSVCMPLIESGLEVFDSELLLNGIVTQRLEFARYRLFP